MRKIGTGGRTWKSQKSRTPRTRSDSNKSAKSYGTGYSLLVVPNENAIELAANGKRLKFKQVTEKILRSLLDFNTHSIAELCKIACGEIDRETIRALLGELILEGLVTVVESDLSTDLLPP